MRVLVVVVVVVVVVGEGERSIDGEISTGATH